MKGDSAPALTATTGSAPLIPFRLVDAFDATNFLRK